MKQLMTGIKEKVKISLWDAFITYIEIIYYPGAIESLDSGLVSLEYENFKVFYSKA